MKHLTPITVLKAQEDGGPVIVAILDRVFAFVLDLVNVKQKAPQPLV